MQRYGPVMEQYGVARDVLCDLLHLSPRNFLRRKGQKRLSPEESDRLYRLARVLAHANRVFEDPDESADWIQTPNVSLDEYRATDSPIPRILSTATCDDQVSLEHSRTYPIAGPFLNYDRSPPVELTKDS